MPRPGPTPPCPADAACRRRSPRSPGKAQIAECGGSERGRPLLPGGRCTCQPQRPARWAPGSRTRSSSTGQNVPPLPPRIPARFWAREPASPYLSTLSALGRVSFPLPGHAAQLPNRGFWGSLDLRSPNEKAGWDALRGGSRGAGSRGKRFLLRIFLLTMQWQE